MEKVIIKSNGRDISCQLTNDGQLVIDKQDPIDLKGMVSLLTLYDFNQYIESINEIFYSLSQLGAKLIDTQDENLLCSFLSPDDIYVLKALKDSLKEMKNEG
ncbi:hypothetical protein ACUNWD_10030 [Sunxiuqinia sp. A32]|uniref:hypothetical protein n=1 Tax=Sunxiuqinia sp. A32 TaxID=3461496 RepID=UPI0040467700